MGESSDEFGCGTIVAIVLLVLCILYLFGGF